MDLCGGWSATAIPTATAGPRVPLSEACTWSHQADQWSAADQGVRPTKRTLHAVEDPGAGTALTITVRPGQS